MSDSAETAETINMVGRVRPLSKKGITQREQ